MVQKATDFNVRLGKMIRRRRRSIGMTQSMLARTVGVRHQQIQKYEVAQNKVSAERLGHIAKALGVSTSYFYDSLMPTEQSTVQETAPRVQKLPEDTEVRYAQHTDPEPKGDQSLKARFRPRTLKALGKYIAA